MTPFDRNETYGNYVACQETVAGLEAVELLIKDAASVLPRGVGYDIYRTKDPVDFYDGFRAVKAYPYCWRFPAMPSISTSVIASFDYSKGASGYVFLMRVTVE